jgi:tRNA A-37 threonylcarbamoyl transferase component Bud32
MSAARPVGTLPFELAGFRGLVVHDFRSAVHTRLLPDPEAVARRGRVLRETTGRVTSRVAVEGGGAVLLKVHRPRRRRERLLSLVRTGRARAEWDAARYLYALGAPVPSPLAVGERRVLGMVVESLFAARFLGDLVPVADGLAAQPTARRARLLERLAVLIRGLHDRGFDHRDLHTGNVLMGPQARSALVLTDLHRSRWGAAVGPRRRRRAVAQWLHSLRGDLDAAGRRAWIESYLGHESEAWVRDVETRILRRERVRLRSRGARCFRESTVYTSDVGAGRGWRRRALSRERLDSVLAAHGAAREPGHAAFVKRSGKAVVTRHGDVVVKERLAAGPLERLEAALGGRRHAGGYRNAHRLGVRGVSSARPMAWLRREGRTYALFEDLSSLPRLDHLAHRLFRAGDRTAAMALLAASARWLADLHARGIYHGDLKAVNVLVDETAEGPVFHLIDTDRVRFFRRGLDERRVTKNLAQLAASIGRCVTRTDRLRWYRRYASAWGAAPPAARVAPAVAAQLARKIVVVDEPIE